MRRFPVLGMCLVHLTTTAVQNLLELVMKSVEVVMKRLEVNGFGDVSGTPHNSCCSESAGGGHEEWGGSWFWRCVWYTSQQLLFRICWRWS